MIDVGDVQRNRDPGPDANATTAGVAGTVHPFPGGLDGAQRRSTGSFDETACVAEREGFEPSEPARVHLISSQARSASSGTSPESEFTLNINGE